MKISVGIPVYDKKITIELASCLLTEHTIAQALGDELTIRFLPGCTNLAMGRNQIVKEFLDSGDDKLFFVDSDITFEPGALVKLAHYPVDVVGGAYRVKQADEFYPVAFPDVDELWADKLGLIEMAMLPTGFLCISREAFLKFREHYGNREYESRGKMNYAYFQIPYQDGALYTEDSYFCREWTAIGGKIYMAPEVGITHWDGNIPFNGHIGNWLRGRITAEQAAPKQKEFVESAHA